MADIFISYKSEDREKIEPLAHALEAQGWDVWWDRELIGGDEFETVIPKELAKARCVIVAWSDLALGSNYVRDEARLANQARKLVPILLEPIALPFGYQGLQTEDFSKWKGGVSENQFVRLCAAIRAKIPPVQSQPAVPASPPPISVMPQADTLTGVRPLWQPRLAFAALPLALAIAAIAYWFFFVPDPTPPGPGGPIAASDKRQAKIYLHTRRPDIAVITKALTDAEYSVSGTDGEVDDDKGKSPPRDGVDFSTQGTQGNKLKTQAIAEDLAATINKALGTELKPRPQSQVSPGYFGVWLPSKADTNWSQSPPDRAACYQRMRALDQGYYLVRCFQNLRLCNNFRATEEHRLVAPCEDVSGLAARALSVRLNGGPSQVLWWKDAARKDERSPPTWFAYSNDQFPAPFPQIPPP